MIARVARGLSYFDPAHPRFAARMGRILALVGLLLACGFCAVAGAWARTPFGRYMSGVLLLQVNQYDAVIRIGQGLVRDRPTENAAYYKLLGSAYRRKGDIDAMMEVMLQGTTAIPDSWYAQTERCWYGALFGHAAEVMDSCDRAIELSPPTEGWGYLLRGFARALIGDRQGAIADMTEGLARWHEYESKYARQRQPWDQWLVALKAGQDPFTPEVLEAERARF
jgi:tetratricopeptide (TPR) repeat protein